MGKEEKTVPSNSEDEESDSENEVCLFFTIQCFKLSGRFLPQRRQQ